MSTFFTITGSPIRRLISPSSGSYTPTSRSAYYTPFRLFSVSSSTSTTPLPAIRPATAEPTAPVGAVPSSIRDWMAGVEERVSVLDRLGARTMQELQSAALPASSLLRVISPQLLQLLVGEDGRLGIPDYHKPVLSLPQQTYEVQQPQLSVPVSGGGGSPAVPPTPYIAIGATHGSFHYTWNRQTASFAYVPSSIALSANIQLWEGQTLQSIEWARSINGGNFVAVGSNLSYIVSPNDNSRFEVYRLTVVIDGVSYRDFWAIDYNELASNPFLSIEKNFPFFRAAYNFQSKTYVYSPASITLYARYYHPSSEITHTPSYTWFRQLDGGGWTSVGTGQSLVVYPSSQVWNAVYAVRVSLNNDFFTAFTDVPIVQAPPGFYMCS